MKTNQAVTVNFRHYGEVTVPKGTRLTQMTAAGQDDKFHFVDEFGWIKEKYPYYANPLEMDARSYGINIPAEFVDHETTTSANKHTLGPWKTIPWGGTIEVRDNNNDRIVLVNIGNDNNVIPNQKTRDVANKIAAAPELLKAAKALIKDMHSLPIDLNPQFAALKAAIAKAEGSAA